MQYIQVVETDGDEPIELPTEPDSSLLLTTVSAQFPGACGLKYRNVESGNLRGLRIQDGRLYSPEENWGNHLYYVVFPKENKRKADEFESPAAAAKQRRPAAAASAVLAEQKATDLIVLGLPFTCEKEEMLTYFSQFGEVLMAEVKKDIKSGKSKGFGFVRFAEYESQTRVLNQRHQIAGRWCDVKLPLPKEGSGPVGCRKIFIGRCAEHITEQDFRDYFGKYGEVTDVYIPRPFRGFAFVSFADAYVAPSICGEDHIIKGSSVHVTTAEPKRPEKRPHYADDYGPPPRGRSDRPDYYDSYGGGDGHAPRSRGDHGWDHPSGSQSRGSDVGGSMANNPLASMGFNLGSFAMNPAMLAAAAMASQNFTNMLMQSAQNNAAGAMPGGQGQAQQQPAIPPTQPPGPIQPAYSSGNPGSYGSGNQGPYSSGGQGTYSSASQSSYGSANPASLGGPQASYGWSSSTQALENGR